MTATAWAGTMPTTAGLNPHHGIPLTLRSQKGCRIALGNLLMPKVFALGSLMGRSTKPQAISLLRRLLLAKGSA